MWWSLLQLKKLPEETQQLLGLAAGVELNLI